MIVFRRRSPSRPSNSGCRASARLGACRKMPTVLGALVKCSQQPPEHAGSLRRLAAPQTHPQQLPRPERLERHCRNSRALADGYRWSGVTDTEGSRARAAVTRVPRGAPLPSAPARTASTKTPEQGLEGGRGMQATGLSPGHSTLLPSSPDCESLRSFERERPYLRSLAFPNHRLRPRPKFASSSVPFLHHLVSGKRLLFLCHTPQPSQQVP